jgi:hypothetical protein
MFQNLSTFDYFDHTGYRRILGVNGSRMLGVRVQFNYYQVLYGELRIQDRRNVCV